MEREAIKEFIREMVGPNVALVDHPEWVGFCCILSEWTHHGGKDNSPSCGISVQADGTSIYHCWSCGAKGSVPWLLRQIEKYTGENYAKLIRELERGEFLGGALPEWGDKRMAVAKPKALDAATYMDLYDPGNDHWYPASRGITASTCDTIQLLVDTDDGHGEERILFPVFGGNGDLYGFTGRAVRDNVEPRIRDYHGLPKKNVLLGQHLLQQEDSVVIVVEGLFDYAKLVQFNLPVVATLHAGITTGQRALLLDIGKPIVWMFDNDEPGAKATIAARKSIGKQLPQQTVKYPSRVTPRRAKARSPKDPATCTEQEVYTMIEKATIV